MTLPTQHKHTEECFKLLMRRKTEARDEVDFSTLIKRPSPQQVPERIMGSRELALPPLTTPANIYIMYT